MICSRSEGFPNTLFEFNAALITTPVGSISKVLTDKPYLSFPVGDHLSLAAKLIEIAKDPERFAKYRSASISLRQEFNLERKPSCLEYD